MKSKILMVAALCASPVLAQPNNFQVVGQQLVPPAAQVNQLEQMVEKQRKLYQNFLDVQIDQLQRECKLNEAQTKKLQVAAKGAAEKAVAQYKKQIQPMMNQFGQMDMDIEVFAAPPAMAIPAVPVLPAAPAVIERALIAEGPGSARPSTTRSSAARST